MLIKAISVSPRILQYLSNNFRPIPSYFNATFGCKAEVFKKFLQVYLLQNFLPNTHSLIYWAQVNKIILNKF